MKNQDWSKNMIYDDGKGNLSQYVGARYVPLMMGEWSASTSYEYLSQVSYLGSIYMSKKNVPIGTNPTNTDYWMLIPYNMRIEDFQLQLEYLQKQINENEMNTLNMFDNYEVALRKKGAWIDVESPPAGLQPLYGGISDFPTENQYSTFRALALWAYQNGYGLQLYNKKYYVEGNFDFPVIIQGVIDTGIKGQCQYTKLYSHDVDFAGMQTITEYQYITHGDFTALKCADGRIEDISASMLITTTDNIVIVNAIISSMRVESSLRCKIAHSEISSLVYQSIGRSITLTAVECNITGGLSRGGDTTYAAYLEFTACRFITSTSSTFIFNCPMSEVMINSSFILLGQFKGDNAEFLISGSRVENFDIMSRMLISGCHTRLPQIKANGWATFTGCTVSLPEMPTVAPTNSVLNFTGCVSNLNYKYISDLPSWVSHSP